MTSPAARARELATTAHTGQVDKQGRDCLTASDPATADRLRAEYTAARETLVRSLRG